VTKQSHVKHWSVPQTWPLLPATVKAPVPATNFAQLAFSVDADASPACLAADQAHLGRLAAAGDPRGFDDGGYATAARAARAVSGVAGARSRGRRGRSPVARTSRAATSRSWTAARRTPTATRSSTTWAQRLPRHGRPVPEADRLRRLPALACPAAPRAVRDVAIRADLSRACC
jgi:hypothetical protein